MARFYSFEECLRKSNQESELGSIAINDGDHDDAKLHFQNSKIWQERANEGGWEFTPEEKEEKN